MHFKETVSILSLKYEPNQIKNGKMLNSLVSPPKSPKLTPKGTPPQ